jgi:hypothetical protein
MKTLLILALLSIPAVGQIPSYELTVEDSAKVKLYSVQKQVDEKEFVSLQDKITSKYLETTDPKEAGNCMRGPWITLTTSITYSGQYMATTTQPDPSKKDAPKYIKKGWGCGSFNFSNDYKYIYTNQSEGSNQLERANVLQLDKIDYEAISKVIASKNKSEEALTEIKDRITKARFSGLGCEVSFTSSYREAVCLPVPPHSNSQGIFIPQYWNNTVLTNNGSMVHAVQQ